VMDVLGKPDSDHKVFGEHFLATVNSAPLYVDTAISTILGRQVPYFGLYRPDLVDSGTGQVYEIKPFGVDQYLQGIAQLTLYVSTLRVADPLDRPWSYGSTYDPPRTLNVDMGVVAFVGPPIKAVIQYEIADLRIEIGTITFAIAGDDDRWLSVFWICCGHHKRDPSSCLRRRVLIGRMAEKPYKKELLARYYRWALADSRREVEQGLPMVRLVRSVGALTFIEMMGARSKDEQFVIARLLVKRAHKAIAEPMDPLTPGEARHVEARHVEEWVQERGNQIAQTGYRKANELGADRPLELDRRRFAYEVKQSLVNICGPHEELGQGAWQHERSLGDFLAQTRIDVGGRQHQLTYGHTLKVSRSVLMEHVSLLSWLGISVQTQWVLRSESDAAAAAASLRALCAHFLGAASARFAT
jgi:hypothetical protein